MSDYIARKKAAMQRSRGGHGPECSCVDCAHDRDSGLYTQPPPQHEGPAPMLKKVPREKRKARRTDVQREHDRHDADGLEPQTPEQQEAHRRAMDEVSQAAPAEDEDQDDETEAQGEPRRRPGRKAAALGDTPKTASPSTAAEGWYVCCGDPFYVGFGWKRRPACPKCGEDSRLATRGEVFK